MKLKGLSIFKLTLLIQKQPTTAMGARILREWLAVNDYEPVIRCKDCELFYTDDYGHGCCGNNYAGLWDGEPEDFCSWSEAKVIDDGNS